MRHNVKPVPESSRKTVSVVNQVPIFDKLDDEEIDIVIRHMGYLTVEEGETLFVEGEEADYVCFIVSGALDVVKKVDEEGKVALTCLRKGRSVGEMAIIDSLKRSATITAREKTNLLVMSQSQFDHLLSTHPATGIKILKGLAIMLSQNLRKAASRLADYMLPMS